MNRFVAAWVLASLFFSGCKSRQMPEKKINPDAIYFDYLVWGDEESGTVTLKLQYRAGGRNQSAIVLKAPAKVEFDGVALSPDSSKFTGPYYEVISPANDFKGEHHIVFTDVNKKTYTASFDFPVISLSNKIDSIFGRDDLILEFAGLKPYDKVRVLLTDTSFYGRGIEKVDTIENNRLVITKEDLRDIKNGPVYMEIFREEDKWLDETMESGGRFYLTYGLKREFVLKDSVR